jgi:hypothetical protein
MQIATVLLIVGFSSYAAALSPIGPTQAINGQDQWGFGLNVGFQSMDLEADGTFFEYPPPSADTRYTPDKIKLEDIKTISSFVQISRGLCPHWDIYGCIGTSDAQGDATVKASTSLTPSQAFSDGQKFDINGSHDLAWGFGTRFTLKDSDTIKWGGTARMTWQKPKGNSDWTANNYRVDGNWELDYWELIVAFGPTFVYDNVEFYTGPFLHMVRGDLNFEGTTTDGSRATTSQDLEEEAMVGGYAGMQMDLYENVVFYVDGQFTGNAWGVGMGGILRTK